MSVFKKLRTILGCAAAVLLLSGGAGAEIYPSKPIRVLVNSAPGGLTDVIARLVVTRMSTAMGQPMVVDNRSGAGGVVGAELLAKAEPDGYTIGVVASAITVAPQLLAIPPFNPARDYSPVALLTSTPLVLVTNVHSPYRSVTQLVADAKARPGKIAIANGGNATMTHLLAEQLQAEAGISLVNVPYKGGAPALNDVLAGHVPLYFDTLNTSVKLIQEGKLRALAVVSSSRSPALPDLPMLAEAGYPGVQGTAWFAMVAPANVSPQIIAKLNEEANKVLAEPDVRNQIVSLGGTVEGGMPSVLAERIRSEMVRWEKLIRERGIKSE